MVGVAIALHSVVICGWEWNETYGLSVCFKCFDIAVGQESSYNLTDHFRRNINIYT